MMTKQYHQEADKKLEAIETMTRQNCNEIDRKLELIKAKQEMVLMKQDQIRATLHGKTARSHNTLPPFTVGATPPFLSPKFTTTTFPHNVPLQATPTAVCISEAKTEIHM